MAMEWSPISWGAGAGAGAGTGTGTGTMMVVEQAKEELQILEAQHPNRFHYLKLELKSFICLLQSQNMLLSTNSTSLPASSTATTQASSTSKKRKKCPSEMRRTEEEVQGGNIKARKQKNQRVDCNESLNRRRWDRVEVVLERARACLWKIQQFKTSFN